MKSIVIAPITPASDLFKRALRHIEEIVTGGR
jgi:hypothetical protein